MLLAVPFAVAACQGSQIVTPFAGLGDTQTTDAGSDDVVIADVEEDSTNLDAGDTNTDDTGAGDVGDEDVAGTTCAAPNECPTFLEPCFETSCTDGKCVATEVAAGDPCDDGDGCTVLDLCEQGACVPGLYICPCATLLDCAPFEDGDVCNGTRECTADGCRIIASSVITCDAPAAGGCEAVQCNATTGACETVPANTGEPCSELSACGDVRYCLDGACTVTVSTSCDDGNACTVDACGTACTHSPVVNGTLCSDADPCTASDKCTTGVCGGVTGLCPATCAVDADCDVANDGNLCNGSVRCLGAAGAKACVFDATTVVACSTAGTGPCEATFCVPSTGTCTTVDALNGLSCDDSDLCTQGSVCAGGVCSGGALADCSDNNPCTVDTCTALGCVHAPASLGTACSDGNACTQNDTCELGICRPGTNSCTCTTNADCLTTPGLDLCLGTPLCINGACELAPGSGPSCVAPGPCFSASCEPSTGACAITARAGGSVCDDGNACTASSECVGTLCKGTEATQCNDGNPCTHDACAPGIGCVYTAATGACTDGESCTAGDQCAGGTCVPGLNVCPCTATSDCAVFDDESLCTGALVCDVPAGVCHSVPNSAVVCPAATNPCMSAVCAPTTGLCVEQAALDGQACEDGSNCTRSDVCIGGQCRATGLVACDDGNPCTVDECTLLGGCTHSAGGTVCDDGNPCTLGDSCALGACKPGTQNAACTCTVNADCLPLEDGDLCNGTLICVAGACVAKPASVVTCAPTAGALCSKNVCVPATGACVAASVPNGTGCSDSNVCTVDDICASGACVAAPLVCDDGNSCTTDSCDPVTGCLYVPFFGGCDDGEVCTSLDLCLNGHCTGLANLCGCSQDADCASLNNGDLCVSEYRCTPSGCEPGLPTVCAAAGDVSGCVANECDPADGLCKLVLAPNGAACSDADVCTTNDKCALGLCVGSGLGGVACDDGRACTLGTCDPVFGCGIVPTSVACSDGAACTEADVCVAGECSGVYDGCDDNNVCTTDDCTEAGCVHENNVLPCSDGNACTTNDGCAAGLCKPGVLVDCDDGNACTTNGVCVPATGVCAGVITLVGTPCSDGNACTGPDTCDAGICKSATTGCDDGNPCTTDICNVGVGCTAEPNSLPCDDGNGCTTNDLCVASVCTGTIDACDDGNPCTTDACVGSSCNNVDNVLPCSDGDLCTTGDGCAGGSCLPGSPTTCDDGNDCTTDGACSSSTGVCTLPTLLTGPTCTDGACVLNGTCCCSVGVCTNENLPAFSCQ